MTTSRSYTLLGHIIQVENLREVTLRLYPIESCDHALVPSQVLHVYAQNPEAYHSLAREDQLFAVTIGSLPAREGDAVFGIFKKMSPEPQWLNRFTHIACMKLHNTEALKKHLLATGLLREGEEQCAMTTGISIRTREQNLQEQTPVHIHLAAGCEAIHFPGSGKLPALGLSRQFDLNEYDLFLEGEKLVILRPGPENDFVLWIGLDPSKSLRPIPPNTTELP